MAIHVVYSRLVPFTFWAILEMAHSVKRRVASGLKPPLIVRWLNSDYAGEVFSLFFDAVKNLR